ncbi:hypothetical protein ACFV2X_17475 [Streptomyces sp. NPDC059679]|uniref:hypothetical protein n=1 Tax=Streptomyces sp. NPDC059679 TaxID=3346903 RepID=UPI003686E81F
MVYALAWGPVSGPPDDHEAAMERPYVVACEQRRLRRQRRRTLRLAAYGIDIGPRVIHGVKVVA